MAGKTNNKIYATVYFFDGTRWDSYEYDIPWITRKTLKSFVNVSMSKSKIWSYPNLVGVFRAIVGEERWDCVVCGLADVHTSFVHRNYYTDIASSDDLPHIQEIMDEEDKEMLNLLDNCMTTIEEFALEHSELYNNN